MERKTKGIIEDLQEHHHQKSYFIETGLINSHAVRCHPENAEGSRHGPALKPSASTSSAGQAFHL
jgi:hypothetical protein